MKPKLFMLVVVLFAATLPGQNTMQVKRITGSDNTIPLVSVGKITFTSTDMVVAGPSTSIPMADISAITFTENTVRVQKETPAISPAKKTVALSASASRILVSFALIKPGVVKVAITDGRGRLVRTMTKNSAIAGTVSLSWDRKDEKGGHVPSGIYLVSALADGKQLTSPQLVLK